MSKFAQNCGDHRKPTQRIHSGEIWPVSVDLGSALAHQIWPSSVEVGRYRGGRTLIRQILSERFHCIGFRWPKNHKFGQFLIFGGLLYRRLLPMRAKFGVLEQT